MSNESHSNQRGNSETASDTQSGYRAGVMTHTTAVPTEQVPEDDRPATWDEWTEREIESGAMRNVVFVESPGGFDYPKGIELGPKFEASIIRNYAQFKTEAHSPALALEAG